MRNNPCHLNIKPPRRTKLGDFRPAHKGKPARLSVNGDLNPYAFLITLLHELAHLKTWNQFERSVKPHGAEWKSEFRNLLIPVFELKVFPSSVEMAVAKYLRNPAASSCTDINLQKALREFDAGEKLPTVDELPINTVFTYNQKRTFRKIEKLRKRIKCQELDSGRVFLFSPLTEVEVSPKSEN